MSLTPLWLGIIGPPAAWAAQLLVSYGAEEVACSPGSQSSEVWGVGVNAVGVVSTIAAVLVTVACGLVAERARRSLVGTESSAAVDRSRFMALLGIASAAYFLVVILLTVVGPVGIPSCR